MKTLSETYSLMKNNIFTTIVATMLVCMMTATASCDSNPEEEGAITVMLNQTEIYYDESGVWTGAMTPSEEIGFQGVIFSHKGMPDWNTWNGFVASRSADVADYSDGNWLEHQYTAITGGGMSGNGTPYMVAYWNSSEVLDNAIAEIPSCSVRYTGGDGTFQPISAFVSNTTYSYYAMKNGTAYSRKFEHDDYCKLLAYGITAENKIAGPVEVYLAHYLKDEDSPVKRWVYFNLESLGRVKTVFFRMESSDSGKWGMNNPAYFAIDRMSIMP